MSIPKRPLAVSRAKKKLPLEIDWGKGIPKDRLRYINAHEEALIKAARHSRVDRSHMGVKAYADDSASSKGVERGADGPSGVGRGSSSGGSTTSSSTSKSTSSSSSASSSTGGGSKASPSSSTTSKTSTQTAAAPASGSKAPNAAAQAASNKLNGVSSSLNASSSISKAPNAAAAAASQKLNATANAPTTAQHPQSIHGMINSQGQYAPNGSYYGPKGGNSLNAAAYGAANRSPQTAANGSYYGPKGTTSLNTDARYAAARSVGFNPDPIQRTPGDAERMGRMMMAESASIKNQYGKVSTPGLMGVGEVIRNRVMSDRYPNTVDKVMNQRSQFSPMGDGSFARTPANATATSIAESILSGESPPTVGTSLNYGNLDTINNKPGYSSSKSKSAFNSMNVEAQVADYRNPNSFAHSFGTIGAPSDVSFNGTGPWGLGSTGLAASAPDISTQRPQGIPSPTGMSMLPSNVSPSSIVSGDPRVSMTPPSNVSAEMGSPPGYFSQFSMTPDDINTMKQQAMKEFGWGQLAEMQKNIGSLPGFMAPITNDQQRVSQMAAATPASPLPSKLPGVSPNIPRTYASNANRLSSPSTWKPEAGPGDQVVSDSPIQGSQNPMQEGVAAEDPKVKQDRQIKYANRGATIGSVIAGPIGAVIGGTLGWQMAKTPPGTRQAIASNPKALNANVQSINTMVEERGGKGNPQMRVTDAGLKDVLTNPKKVASNPQQYTTLEQMLAALALGIDPETGKPIT